jgi:hypothetical protein
MVTITADQKIMMGLQPVDTEEDKFAHYESSLWTGYVKTRVTISPI